MARDTSLTAPTPDFTLMAEVYWDLEWTLQHQGFGYCYDKRLYDRLRDGQWQPAECRPAWRSHVFSVTSAS